MRLCRSTEKTHRFSFVRWVLLWFVLWWCASAGALAAAAPAKHGEIDLSGLDVAKGETAMLNGEWAFYWGQLLTPADFAEGLPQPRHEFLSQPSIWAKSTFDGKKLPNTGYATYRLKVLPPAGSHMLALRMSLFSLPYRIWINHVLVAENGIVSDRPEIETHSDTLQIIDFHSDGTPIDLLVQMSNHQSSDAQFKPIQLGLANTLHFRQAQRWSFAMLLIGGMLVMGSYHLALFVMRKRDLSSLYFSLYCLIRILYSLYVSDAVIYLLFPKIAPESPYVLMTLSVFATPAISLAFFRSFFPQEFSARFCQLAVVICGTVIAIYLMAGFHWPPFAERSFYSYSIVVIAYILFCLIKAWRAQRPGANLIVTGYLILTVTLVNDILNASSIINTVFLIPVGMFALILFQSFALAQRFTNTYRSVENLSGKLEVQNVALQEEIAERSRLEQEIERISEEERRTVSRQLHDGLCQELTAARLHCTLLTHKVAEPSETAKEVKTLSSLLGKAVNQAYELSRGLWPVEHETRNLVASLEELAHQIRASHQLEITISNQLSCEACTNQDTNQIFYIAREALQNVCKHAQAKRVWITLDCSRASGCLTLRIEDDGTGPLGDTPSRGSGLGSRIMAHRAQTIGARFSLAARPEGGTIVSLISPCHKNQQKALSD